jgi:hypothetical protein
MGGDSASVRAFDRRVDGRELEFFVPEADSLAGHLLDGETGSAWDFTGRAVRGTLAGTQLARIAVLKDYWFDWKAYHPRTSAYTAGRPRS